MQTKVKNISNLIKDMSSAYELLRANKMSLNEAREIAHLGGQMIKGASVQLKYNQYMKINDPIEFLEAKPK